MNGTGNDAFNQPTGNVVVPDSLLYPLMISCVVAVLENLTVCVLIAMNRTLRTATNTFVFSLCIADICFAGLILPIHCFYSNSIIYEYLVLISILTYILNLTSVTYERLVSLTNPLRYHAIITKRFALKITLVAWAIPLPYCLLPAIWDANKKTLAHKIYMTCTLVIFLLAPLIFILFVYGRIFVEIRKLYDHRRQLVLRPRKTKSKQANRLVNALSNELSRSSQVGQSRGRRGRKLRLKFKLQKRNKKYDCMDLVSTSMLNSRDRGPESSTDLEMPSMRESTCCIENNAVIVRYENHSRDQIEGRRASSDLNREFALPITENIVTRYTSTLSEDAETQSNLQRNDYSLSPKKTRSRHGGTSSDDKINFGEKKDNHFGKEMIHSHSLPQLPSPSSCISNVTSCSVDLIWKSKTDQASILASSLHQVESTSVSSNHTEPATEMLSANKCLEDICLTALAVSRTACTCKEKECVCLYYNESISDKPNAFDTNSNSKTLNGAPKRSSSDIAIGPRICGCESKVFHVRSELFSDQAQQRLLMNSKDPITSEILYSDNLPFNASGGRQIMSDSEQHLLSSQPQIVNHEHVSDSADSTSPSERFLSNLTEHPRNNNPDEVTSHVSALSFDNGSSFNQGRRKMCCPLSHFKEHFRRRGKHASRLSILSEEKRRKSHADKFKTVIAELKSSLAFAAVAFTYMFTWIPVGYMTFLDVIDRLDLVPTVLSEVSVFTIALNAVIDPLLYALLLRDFKKYSKKLIRRLCGMKQKYNGW